MDNILAIKLRTVVNPNIVCTGPSTVDQGS